MGFASARSSDRGSRVTAAAPPGWWLRLGLRVDDEVPVALDGAELTYPGATRKRRIAVAGRLAVVHDPIARVIVTILWVGLATRAA